MENIAEDSRKALKLATEIKNMLNGTMENIAEDSRKALILATEIKNMLNDTQAIKDKLEKMHSHIKCYGHLPRECKQIKVSGLQTVYPDGNCNKEVSVQCEEGGWTVIQKRCNGAVEFNRNWNDYENGFGDLHGEFWLGNKNIAQLTSEGNHELMIDVEDWDGNTRYAVYRSFSIGDASTNYRLNISDYSGNAGDGMTFLNGMKFTTYDQDNDLHDSINCANHPTFKGGWWYHGCWTHKEAMLNGHYTSKNSSHQGIIYRTIGKYSQKKSTMKIRRL